MNHKWTKIAVSCLMVLALVATLGLGCGEDEEGKVTITIGHISDMTGPAATALVPINYAMRDIAQYFNEQEDILPGVELKVVEWDARYDPSRDVPGWEWVRARGAEVVVTALPTTAETLATFTDRDKTPLWGFTPSDPLLDDPHWVFLANLPTSGLVMTLLKWISENDWDWKTKGPAKIGSAGWVEPYARDCKNAVKEYAEAHPDQYTWVGGFLAPMGVMTWGGEVSKLKGCDYIWGPTTGLGVPTFMKELREIGGTAKFIGTDSVCAFRSLVVDAIGYDAIDGMLLTLPTRWWNETQSPIISLARKLLFEYHPAQAEDFIYAGIGYCGGFHQGYAFYQILKKAIEDVGAENFDGQAFYDAAITFQTQWDTYEAWGLSDTNRYTWDYVGIYEVSATDEDIVRKVDPWLLAVFE